MKTEEYAPGGPGVEAKWTSSMKSGVGTSLSGASRVWFSISHGVLNEIYYPRVDQACTRDTEFLVTDGEAFFSEEKRDTEQKTEHLSEGVPGYLLTNKCMQGKYTITKKIISDPFRDSLLQYIKFTPAKNKIKQPHLYILLAPHLGNKGSGNTAWVGKYKGTEMLFAERDGHALAIASSIGWINRTVAFVSQKDPWHDLKENKQLTETYLKAENGNVTICGEVKVNSSKPTGFTVAIGFGTTYAEAAQRALASILDGFDAAEKQYIADWKNWQKRLKPIKNKSSKKDIYNISASVLRVHEAKRFTGGLIASLSIPWGFAKGDDDIGGYHLVWPRDMVETVGGLLAAGAEEDAVRALRYLMVTQEEDGHWSQNMWLDGTPFWNAIQMDETSFPILLVDLARRCKALDEDEQKFYWPMVKKAAGFLVSHGPVTQQDRWEEDPGYSPFTLAVEISALLAAADMAESNKDKKTSKYLKEIADIWNENIERWTYVKDTDWANELEIEGYYVRIAPTDEADAASTMGGFVPIKNRPPGQDTTEAVHLISPDALALVRFGLRPPDDPKILNTIKVIDSKLKVVTPYGPAWHRYNGDGWGEHEDGSPFDGTGVGRAWPLLTGERAHYEIAAGNYKNAKSLLQTLEQFSNKGGMLPEQVWDTDDIPDRELIFGNATGSAMPLAWAHAEYIKLLRSLKDKRVFDMPQQTYERYIKNKHASNLALWRFNHKTKTMPKGKTLRVETLNPALIRYSFDDWQTTNDVDTRDTGLGIFTADIKTGNLKAGQNVGIKFYWPEADKWENDSFEITVE